MLLAVLSGFIVALFVPLIQRVTRGATGWILALLPLSLVIYFSSFINLISAGGRPFTYEWFPALNINLSFYLDGLSLIFAIIITGVGTFIVLYGGGYLAGHYHLGRFYIYILMFMGSMLGVVLSDNLITLFVFWELTGITSFLLIGYYHDKPDSRFAALQALLVTGAGGLALLAGLILMGVAGGQWEISALVAQADLIQANPLYLTILVLVLAGAFTKSAQFPFHFWLPGAMAAPAPVSAYLHSATMVKAGVYLVARMSPILGHTKVWLYTVTIFGVVTMLLAAYIAWQQTDLKRILAYSTVSALGTLMMLLGLGNHVAVEAAIVFLVVHSLYKGTLFMVAGTVDHESGTRFINKLGGLRSLMPISMGAALLAAFSMSGFPPFLGFVGKELIYEGTQEAGFAAWVITIAAVLANVLTIIAALLVLFRPFFGAKVATPKQAHEAPWSMLLGPIILSSLGLIIGFLTAQFGHIIVEPAVGAILAEPTHVDLHLWPTKLNTTVLLSTITIIGGIGLYFVRDPLNQAVAPLNFITRWGPEQWYQWILDGTMALARLQTSILQSGYLRYYLIIIILTTVGLTGSTLFIQDGLGDHTILHTPNVTIPEALIYITIIAAAIVIIQTRSRLTAVAALGVIGYGMALIFILFGAPDLAMTQFSIETLSVILLVLVLYRLPRFTTFSTATQRARDMIVALSGGVVMTILVLIVTSLPVQSRLTPYFAENSLIKAKGHNVVNVILVDFRGLDTMGEITVLGIAAIGVYGLLKLRLDRKEDQQGSNK